MNREEAERGGDGELVSKPRGIAWALLAILLSSFSQYTLILQQGIYLIALPSQYYDDFMAFIEAINIFDCLKGAKSSDHTQT